jgi:excisionase family DNA binding protein
VADVAAWLDISTTSVYRLAERREIPFYRLRGALRFAKEDVERFLARQRVEAAEH